MLGHQRANDLYTQDEFKSMDYALSLNTGLTARVFARQQPSVGEEEQDREASSWRKWQQAADAAEQADEAEEFRTVGMRCREALLAFVREVVTDEMMPSGAMVPKQGGTSFIGASTFAQAIAPGGSSEEVRSYLKVIAKGT